MSKALPFNKEEFPQQSRPLFEFLVGDNGNILRKCHHRYVESAGIAMGRKLSAYRIYKSPGQITIKWRDQLDRVLYNRIFSFNPDAERAKEMFREHYAKLKRQKWANAAKYDEILDKLS